MNHEPRIILPTPRNQLIVDLFKGVIARRLGLSELQAEELSRDMVQALIVNFAVDSVRP